MKKQHKKGFTLIELIVVMAVIAILVLLATPKFLSYTKKAKITQIVNDIKVVDLKVSEALIDDVESLKDELQEINIDTLNSYVDENKIYGIKGLLDEIDNGEEYFIISQDYIDEIIKTDLKGEFIMSKDGIVYYRDLKAGEVKTTIKKPIITLSPSTNENELIATINYKNDKKTTKNVLKSINPIISAYADSLIEKHEYKIDNGEWLEYTEPVTMKITSKIYAKTTITNGGNIQTAETNAELSKPSITTKKIENLNSHLVTINFPSTNKTKEYKIGNGSWVPYIEPFSVNYEAVIKVRGYDMDDKIISYNSYEMKDFITNYVTFDGTNDHVVLSTNSPLISKNNNGTIEFWFKYKETDSRLTLYAETATWGESFTIFINNNSLALLSWKKPSSSWNPMITGGTLEPNKWYHFAATWNSSTTWFYLNGELIKQDYTLKTDDSVSLAYIGASRIYNGSTSSNGYFGYFYKGDLSEFRIWNVTKTQDEIRENMPKILTGSEMALLRLYRMNDVGNTLIDYTGYSNATINR